MVGVLDTPDDWEATQIALRLTMPELHGLDSEAFLTGFKLGFLVGYRTRGDEPPRAAYEAWLAGPQ